MTARGETTMPPPAFQRVEELFHQAVPLGPRERSTFLDSACAGDVELRAAIEQLLRHDEEETRTDSFLTSPVAREAQRLRPDPPTVPDAGRGGTTAAGTPLPRIPGYEVLEELGRGGMGVVYRARQTSLHRIVALKMLLPESSAAPEMLARFRTEAEALARLHHPNIVPVYEIGECQGRPYFTMEYVAGPSLARVLDGRPQDAPAAARLTEALARTLHAVHQAGLIHRDLKPANVLIADSRLQIADLSHVIADKSEILNLQSAIPKVTDFGLAKDQTADRNLTQSGVAMGTPCYMAPEQARHRGNTVGPAADVYALGAMLYEMLTGRPPFDAETQAETIVQLLHEEPLSPARLRPQLPRDLVTICLKCLEKSPGRRYASAWDLAEDLRRFLAGEPVRARPVGLVERSYRWCRRRPVVAGLLALMGLLTVAFVITVLVYNARLSAALARTEGIAEQERREIIELHVNRGVTALEEEDTVTAVFFFTEALRLDTGRAERNHRTRIATTLRRSPALLRRQTFDNLVTQEAPLTAALSADGRLLAVAGGNDAVRVWDLQTGGSRDLVVGRGEAARRLAFDSDGRLLLTRYANGRTDLWDLTGQDPVRLQEFSAGEAVVVALSDNGRWLFTLDAGHRGEVWDVAKGKAAAPLQLGPGVKPAAVSPDGRRVALVGPDNVLTVWDVPKRRPAGKPLPLSQGVGRILFSPDEERVVATGSNRSAQVWQVQTGELGAVWSWLDSAVTYLRFSPDGRRLLLRDVAGKGWVWDTATGRPVTPPVRHGVSLAWAAFHDGGKQVVTVSATGTVCFWQLPTGPAVSDAALDGERVATGEAAGGGRRQVKLANGITVSARETTAGPLRPPRPADRFVEHAAFSPGGRCVAVREDDSTVRVYDTATGAALTPSLRHGGAVRYGAFSPDGTRLLTASDDGAARVWDAATGEVLSPGLRHDRAIERVFFRAGGDQACVVHEGGVLSTWDLTPDDRQIDELLALRDFLASGLAGRDR
jgi:serine/threonine protein kinase/WD40 repeat protein